MFPYLAMYSIATLSLLYNLYAAFLRKAPVVDSETLIKQYTALQRYYKQRKVSQK